MLRGTHTLYLHSHFEAVSHTPRIVYPQFALSFRSYFGRSDGRVLSMYTLTLLLLRMLRGSRALNVRPRIEAISGAPKVAYPQITPSR